MDREYDLFELLDDGTPMWRGHVFGLLEARRQLQDIGTRSRNQCFAIHLPTREIVARVNVRTSKGTKPVVFQITYDPKRAAARAEILRLHGYEVMTFFGNEAVKAVLTAHPSCDLFIVGHAAPEETRREMVAWLKTHYPGVRIIALNPPPVPELLGADFNVKLNGPETLLPVIVSALRDARGSGASEVR